MNNIGIATTQEFECQVCGPVGSASINVTIEGLEGDYYKMLG
jgi:hypothetical protein